MSGQPAIQASAVHKSFGAVKALDGLDLAVEKGSVLGLLGPNGAGKTTIVKIISTLLKNFSGEVLVDGIDVAANQDGCARSSAWPARTRPWTNGTPGSKTW